MLIVWAWIISIIVTIYIAGQKKLAVGGFLFLAFLTGPLAVIIVLLFPEKKTPAPNAMAEVNTFQDAKHQLQNIRCSLYALEERIKNLESLVARLSGTSVAVSTVEEKRVDPVPEYDIKSKPVIAKASADVVKKSDMELDFGRNWLNKIGIVILALGVAFLISYSFQYFGPLLKIAFGYLVGGLLFFAGVKSEAKEKFVNYGRVLLGGAWAIIYFTTYAMHHFSASRILASQAIDTLLLVVVVAGMITHVLRYKSETMMLVVLAAAYLTSTIGQVTPFTVLSSLFLSLLTLVFVHKFQWVRILSAGIILTYLIHLLWVVPNIRSSGTAALPFGIPAGHYYDLMNFIFLSLYWALFLAGTHIVRNITEQRLAGSLAASNFGNIALYSVLAYPLIIRLFQGHKFGLVISAGAVYLVLSLLMKRLGREKMYISDIAAAVFAITFSLSLKFLPTSTLLVWLIEIPCLLFIGVNLKERIFRYFAYALSVIVAVRLIFLGMFDGMANIHFFGFEWTWYGFMCFWAGISMAICFYLSQRNVKDPETHSLDVSFDQVFSFSSYLYVAIWVWSLVRQPWVAFSLSSQGLLLLGISLALQLRRFRVYSYLAFIAALIVFLSESIIGFAPVLKWSLVSWNVLAVFGLYFAVKYIKQNQGSDLFFEYEPEISFIAGLILLVAAIHQYAIPHWISLNLGLASAAVIIIGFFDGNKAERMGGMTLLALTLGRVVLVDLSGLDIVFKIITLIILGVLFLGVSYIYNRFSIERK